MTTTVNAFRIGANGLEEIKPRPALPVNSRVFAFGAGMSKLIYSVITEPDERGIQKLVKMSPNSKGDYFGPYHILDTHTRPISKKHGIGFYYDDEAPDFRFDQAEVDKAVSLADQYLIDQERKEKEQAEADEKERRELVECNKHMTPINQSSDKHQIKKNVLADLQKNFPGIKFSMRKDGYDTYYISWTDGPGEKQVKEITDKFNDHSFDYTGDYYDYTPDNFTKVFGGIKFIFLSREFTGKEKIKEDLKVINPERFESFHPQDLNSDFHKLIYQSSFPAGAINFRLEKTGENGTFTDLYKIGFDVPEKKDPATIKTEGVEVVDYKNGIAVIGDTRPIKDLLKEEGGRFNPRLDVGPGWIFPKHKKAKLESIL